MNTSKTLLAILVEELPKCDGVPSSWDYVMQDYDKQLRFGGLNGPYLSQLALNHRKHGMYANHPDYEGLKVTREQYEAALAAHQQFYVAPCKEDGECNVVRCEAHEAEFFTLYRRDDKGLSQAVRDFPTRQEAEAALANLLASQKKPCPTLGAECMGCPDCGRRVNCKSDDITDAAVRAELGISSRANDDRLAQDLAKSGLVVVPEGTDCRFISDDENDLNDCIGQPAEDNSLLVLHMLAVMQDADVNIRLNDAFELAEMLVDAGYRKQ